MNRGKVKKGWKGKGTCLMLHCYVKQLTRLSFFFLLVIKDLFDYLCKIPNNKWSYTKEELQSLMLKYGVR